MDRRNFLRLLTGAVITKPVTYILPPLGGWRQDSYTGFLLPEKLIQRFAPGKVYIGADVAYLGDIIYNISSVQMENMRREIQDLVYRKNDLLGKSLRRSYS